MTWLMCVIAIFTFLSCQPKSALGHSRFSDERVKNLLENVGNELHYIAPNECFPQYALPFIQRADKGWVVGVGTYRLFFVAAMGQDKFNGILSLDHDPLVKLFIEMFADLFRMSHSMEDLEHLWFKATLQEWNTRAREISWSDSPVFSGSMWQLWHDTMDKKIPQIPAHTAKWLLDAKRWSLERRPIPPFEAGNFFVSPKAYQTLKKLADNYAILAETVDLAYEDSIKLTLEKFTSRISYLDLSCLHFDCFLGAEKVAEIIPIFLPWLTEHKQIVITAHVPYPFNKNFPMWLYGHIGATLTPEQPRDEQVSGLLDGIREFMYDIRHQTNLIAFEHRGIYPCKSHTHEVARASEVNAQVEPSGWGGRLPWSRFVLMD